MSPPDACRECVVFRARIEKCYEVAELGEAIGVTRQTVIAIEQNRYSPSLESAFRIARFFGVGLEDVFSWEE